jgi:hypothetical protein
MRNLVLLLLLPIYSIGQVGINTTAPKAALDIESTNNGVLIPRVQLTDALDVLTVVNPAGGALPTATLIYNISDAGGAPNDVIAGFYYWNGNRWIPIAGNKGWELDGNSAITSPAVPATYGTSTIGATENFIGTTDNNDVTVGTNNIERLRVKNTTGNVGIGISNPSSTLEIVSNGTTELKLGSRGAFGVSRVSMISDKELPNEWRPSYIESADNGGFTGRMDFFTNGTGIANKFGSTRAMSITNGNVGIGTTNPTKKLDIVAPNNEIGLQILSGNNSELSYLSLGRTIEYAQIGACIASRFFLDALDGDMAIKNFGAGKILLGASVNTNADMSIVPGGNVGIGTVTPTLARFQVNGMTGNTTALFRGNSISQGISMAADWPGLYFNCYYNGGQRAMASSGFPTIINTDQDSGGLTFHTSNIANTAADALLATNILERMRIDGDGEVGIGTNNPLAKLHVVNSTAGAIRIEDGTQANGNVLRSDANGVGTWQNPNSFAWSLNGNTAITTPIFPTNYGTSTIASTENFIGTTDNQAIVFGTNNIERMRINNITGQVKIGPYPSLLYGSAFDVYTNQYVAGVFRGNASSNIGIIASAEGITPLGVKIGGMFSAYGGTSNYAIIVPPNSGDVGFGTNIPSTKLHVENSTAGALRIVDGTQANGNVFRCDANGVGTWQNPNTFAWSLSGNTVNAATDFLGSTNNANVIFKRNNIQAGSIAASNTSLGVNTLLSLTSGVQNVAIGTNALDSNIISGGNTAVGYDALQSTTGDFNTAIGNSALFSLAVGTSNCAFGYNALNNQTSGINNIGIGTGANVPFTTGNNQIRMGNTAIAYAGIQVAWSVTSDRRWKSDIQTSSLGLNFINKLNPVSYIRKNDESKKTEYGFIAQELDQTLKEFGAINNGIITKDDEGMLSVRYNDLLAPMVKSIQELKVENDKLKAKNEALEARLKKIEEKINN